MKPLTALWWVILAVLIALPSTVGATAAMQDSAGISGAIIVQPGDDLQATIDGAPEGSTIEVQGGTHPGPIEIDRTVTLLGTGGATIDGRGEGTIVRISNAPGTVLQGFTIEHSGSSFDKEDSAVYVESSDAAEIRDNHMLDTLFGVNVAQSHDIVIADNLIVGRGSLDTGVRGDGIKVWYSHRSQITGNEVRDSRDLLVWYSNEVVVSDNEVHNGRYGFHFMNSDDGIAERNVLVDNSVGIYLMYGRHFTIEDNLLEGSRGPSGHGLGLKEIDGVDVIGNVIHDNRIGVYIDNSPLSPDVHSTFENNLIAYNDTGLGMLPSTMNNTFTANSLIENLEQVTVLGGGAIGDNQWTQNGIGNYWSDYAGYDADGDGIGDVAYRSENASEQLMSSWPILQLFRFSVAESAVDFGARAVPVFRTEPKLTDPSPLVEPVVPTSAATRTDVAGQTLPRVASIAMLALACGTLAWIWYGRRRTERFVTTTMHALSSRAHRPAAGSTGNGA